MSGNILKFNNFGVVGLRKDYSPSPL